ncbi:MAG: hypothetical protein M3X11_22730 [Acidobacteriota bacterium]|nr:hypothetical protein [Acidobacteriota bacterium]
MPSIAPPDLPAINANGFNIAATALDGDQSLERFEANLPMAGVIAVDVRLINHTAAAVNPRSLKLKLRNAGGKSFKEIAPKRALKRVMKFYGNSVYRLDVRQSTIDSYNAVALPLSSPVAPQEERRGLLFFQVQRNTTKLDDLTLSATGAKPPINVKTN